VKVVEGLRLGFGHSDPSALARVLLKQRRDFEAISALDFFPTPAKARAQQALADTDQEIRKLYFSQAPAAIGTGEKLHGRTWATRKPLWADRLASAWLVRRFVDPEAKMLWLDAAGEPPPGAIGFGFEGAHFAAGDALVAYEEIMRQLQLGANQAIARIGAIVHYLEAGGAPVQEAAGVQTLLQGAVRRAQNDDELLAEAEKTFDLLYEAYFEPPPRSAAPAADLALVLGGLLRAQLLQARVDHGELVEVAVARAARELQLLDRGWQASLQRVVLALRLVLQQALAERGVRARLQRP
jgi:hypothetical protein